ncbi:COX4, subunit IV of cytochrome c oxidase [Endogone sp. FLAS-F59071]|nr:COX4, subunit IV of cytochrome c oxidase [Endogone sp. FLAS-F59071]|eukprot:RUS21288.1 COX4, subunit IV of cytochrome c oxidase [Endogone sp. FLAS-F59071]
MFRAVTRPNVAAVRAVSRRNASTSYSTPSTYSAPSTSYSTPSTAPALANIETKWRTMPTSEQNAIIRVLEQLQKEDWTGISLEDKKAAYWVAFGPHGPREPLTAPGHNLKVIGGVTGIILTSAGFFMWTRSKAEKPRTVTKEWQEASNEYMKSQNMNPITGISSENYKGKGMVTST